MGHLNRYFSRFKEQSIRRLYLELKKVRKTGEFLYQNLIVSCQRHYVAFIPKIYFFCRKCHI